MKISFLASHGGSSARAIIAAIDAGELDADKGILITNNGDSAIYRWCRDHDFPVHHVSAATHPGKVDETILSLLEDSGTDIVVLSGYMKKIGPRTLEKFGGRILNIHPALLPKHGGRGMYGDRVHEAVLAAGEKQSGASVHVVTEDYDEGPVIARSLVDVLPGDTVETLRQRVQATEAALYVDSLRQFLKESAL